LGTITPKNQNITLTAKIITTDTAEIVGAGRTQFKIDDTIDALMAKPVVTNSVSNPASTGHAPAPAHDSGEKKSAVDADKAQVVKSIGDLHVELQSLTVVNNRQYQLTMTLENQAKKRTIYVALHGGMFGNGHGSVFDPNGFEFVNSDREVTGVTSTMLQYPTAAFTQATEIDAGESITATVTFHSGRTATTGNCRVQLEFLTGYDFNNGYGTCTVHSLNAKMEAE
jgi:hypothetical protein